MVSIGPALVLFAVIAAALALVTYLYMEAENRHQARERRRERTIHLVEEYFRLKEDLGLDPDSAIDNESEYFEIYEAIENANDFDDDDRRDLIRLLEAEFETRLIPLRP